MYLEFGQFAIRWYTLILLVSVLACYFLLKRRVAQTPFFSHLDNLFLIAIITGIIGARLYHVVDHWDYYRLHLPVIFQIWQGGLGIFGALLFGLTAAIFYSRKNKIDLLSLLDLATPYLLLGQALGRIGNYFNSEGYGPATNLPWGIYIEKANARVHPTFFYEAVWDLLGFIILKKIKVGFKGGITAYYLVIYGSGRFLAEYFRLDTASIYGVKVGYVISILLIAAGLFLGLRSTKLGKYFRRPNEFRSTQ